MIKNLAIIVVSILFFSAQAQEVKKYSWDEKPVFKEIPKEYLDQPAVVLFDKRWIHTRLGSYAYATFIMNHKAVKIFKAEEINKYNKIKAEDNGYVRDLRDFHARIIKPNGDIKVLPKEKIVEVEIDKVKSIVFEGVEAGDILEYYFILKETPVTEGTEIFQDQVPVLEAEFTTTSEGVKFRLIPSEQFKISESKGKTIATAINLPAHDEESAAKNFKNLIKIIHFVYSTSYNTNNWTYHLPTYFTKPAFAYFKNNQARDFIEKLGVEKLPVDEKLIKIDNFIKDNFDFSARNEKQSKVKDLSSGKQKLTARDIFNLYGFTLKELEIPYQVVVGMSRFIGDVSEEMYVTPLPHELMYYIPETKKFLSPYETYLSYGYPAYEVQGSKVVTYSPNSKKKAVDTSMVVPIAPAEHSIIESETKVNLMADNNTAKINKVLSSTGYEGQLFRGAVKYFKEFEEEKDLKDFVKDRSIKGIDAKIIDYTIDNSEFKYNYTNTPLKFSINAETIESLVETAGNLLLVNIGKVIGEQGDLYQETTRKFDVDLKYAKIFKHKIVFTIPEGYEIESYNDLIIDKKMEGDQTNSCSFKSTVKIGGNILIVEVVEQYLAINYPVAKYLDYRKVINAAADFSKASVVLKPKKK